MAIYHALTDAAMTPLERAHLDLVRRLAGQCMVVLENDGTLPLAEPCPVALFGNGARATVKGGTGSGDVNARFTVSVEEGLEAAGFTVTTKDWLDAQAALTRRLHQDYWTAVEAEAARTGQEPMFVSWAAPFVPQEITPFSAASNPAGETAVYVLARNSGEGADRFRSPGDYQLLPGELALLTELGRRYKRLIVLLNVGGVVDAAAIRAVPGVSALVLIGQSGAMGGHAVADVLLGKTDPSGRLASTWAKTYADYPAAAAFSHNGGQWHEAYYRESIYVGYRYFDTFGVEPLYPFGYGLGYASFSRETVEADADEHGVRLQVRVVNTGDRPGREVVQVYAAAPYYALEKPRQVLAAFGKTGLLAPGEAETLSLTFPLERLESFSAERCAYVLERGDYLIRVGRHSRDTEPVLRLRLDGDAETRRVRHICPLEEPMETLSRRGAPVPAEKRAEPPTVILAADRIPAETVAYAGEPAPLPEPDTGHIITLADVRAGRYTLEQLTAQLTVAELADLCVGAARAGEIDASQVVGRGARAVPGAAGDITPRLAYRGVPGMVNADGPAGLRLAPRFRVTAAGEILAPSKAFSEYLEEFPPKAEGDVDYYQFCTAIPVASLLACSWDLELLEAMGDLVGAEMARYGVRTWLAPGMNLHRDPLCGRNFEYFSEDPVLSGLCAGAEVRGVQRHPGADGCIKHFFANNQEDNRMSVNEHIDEQALRELYLRNFALAIETSNPASLMTSYNLVNGVHTANSYDAITAYAREEHGFSGFVMTDWSTSSAEITALVSRPDSYHRCASSPACIRAGNDLQMPGTQENVDDIIAAVEDGTLPVGCLQRCALRILAAVLRDPMFETIHCNTGGAI